MNKKNFELNITWLYPKEMSTYGDRGNIIALKKRCEWRGINVNIDEVGLKETPREDWTDIYFFGGGQDQAQSIIAKDLLAHKKNQINIDVTKNKVFLGVCGGYQLFGHYYKDSWGNEIPGVGILNVHTVAGKRRLIGNIVVESDFIKEKIVGFENHSGKTYLGKEVEKLGTVLVGNGNNGEDRTEGARKGNIFGCYLHGPILPKNPVFADFLVQTALQNKYPNFDLSFLNDTTELLAHEKAIERSYKAR